MNFLDALQEARRRAILSGKPLTNSEIQGMQQGYFSGEAKLSNEKRAQRVREQQAQESLRLQKEMEQEQLEAAKKAGLQQTAGNVVNTAGTVLATDYLNKPAGESLVSKGYQGVKNYFSPSQPTFTEAANAGAAGAGEMAAAEGAGTVANIGNAAVQGAATEGAVEGGATLAGGAGGTVAPAGGTAAGATLGSVVPWVGLASTAAKVGGTLGEQWGKHSLGLSRSSVPMQFARTLQNPWEISQWVDEIYPNMGWKAKTAKNVLDPVGFVAEKAGCIIVTVCTDRNSPEVNLTREYRDKFMTPEQLRGYYMIAEKVVPWINRSRIIKYLVKRLLVDRLVEYGEFVLGKTKIIPSFISCLITDWFMDKCERKGKTVQSFIRNNGEVV